VNDEDREDWVRNDEALYELWQQSHEPLRRFVRSRRVTLTAIIMLTLANKRRRGDPVVLKRDDP
jgi:hypothetical protein